MMAGNITGRHLADTVWADFQIVGSACFPVCVCKKYPPGLTALPSVGSTPHALSDITFH